MPATPQLQGKVSEFGLGTSGTPSTEVDLTDYILDFNFNVSAESVPVRVWGSGSFAANLQGNREGTIELTVLDDTEGVAEDHFKDLQDSGNAANYEYFPNGNATGKRVTTGTARVLEMSEPNSGEGSDVKSFEVTLALQQQPTRGTVA